MKISISKISSKLKSYAVLITFSVIVLLACYLFYFFFENIYLTVTESSPLERTVIKEKINNGTLKKVEANLDAKINYTLEDSEIKNIFE